MIITSFGESEVKQSSLISTSENLSEKSIQKLHRVCQELGNNSYFLIYYWKSIPKNGL